VDGQGSGYLLFIKWLACLQKVFGDLFEDPNLQRDCLTVREQGGPVFTQAQQQGRGGVGSLSGLLLSPVWGCG